MLCEWRDELTDVVVATFTHHRAVLLPPHCSAPQPRSQLLPVVAASRASLAALAPVEEHREDCLAALLQRAQEAVVASLVVPPLAVVEPACLAAPRLVAALRAEVSLAQRQAQAEDSSTQRQHQAEAEDSLDRRHQRRRHRPCSAAVCLQQAAQD
jgi:hypothetical protein